MYDRMAKEAKEEGFKKIAYLFEEVAKIEKEHENRYRIKILFSLIFIHFFKGSRLANLLAYSTI